VRSFFPSLLGGFVLVCTLFTIPLLSSAIAKDLQTDPDLPIVPGLRGFGIYTPAGSGRHTSPTRTSILRISSLQDSGPATLRECLESRTPRICVFEVAGEIQLRTPLRIRSPYITVAGQTAPPPGITISRGGISIETHDVLLQHLAVRPGDSLLGAPARTRDAISIGGAPPRDAYNVVIDHLSLTWAVDENISTWHPSTHDVTITQSIIAEGLHRSIHPKGPHSKGVMIGNGSSRITLFKNLIAANDERNPYIKPGTRSEIINNVVYGWGARGPWTLCNLTNNDKTEEPVFLSFIGNTYVAAPWSFIGAPVYAKRLASTSRVYLRDNRFIGTTDKVLSDWAATTLPETPFRALVPPLVSPGSSTLPSGQAYFEVLRNAGSRPFNRSRIDRRIVRQTTRRRGSIKDCIKGCSRSVGVKPNPRVRYRKLQLPIRPHDDDDRDGYTNIENWLMRFSLGSNR
jgi:hypothetical protein